MGDGMSFRVHPCCPGGIELSCRPHFGRPIGGLFTSDRAEDRAGPAGWVGSYARLMSKPRQDVEGCRTAHQHLRAVLEGLGDTDVTRASLLPGWSVGHVLTHLARNAEAMCRRIEGAIRSELVEQYPSGVAGREVEIERGAIRSLTVLRQDVVDWSSRLEDLFDSIDDDVWSRPVRTVSGTEHEVALLPFRRWREVEVHLVDLGMGVSPVDWSQALVDRALPGLLGGLGERADQRDLMAWLLGRGPAPALTPWG